MQWVVIEAPLVARNGRMISPDTYQHGCIWRWETTFVNDFALGNNSMHRPPFHVPSRLRPPQLSCYLPGTDTYFVMHATVRTEIDLNAKS